MARGRAVARSPTHPHTRTHAHPHPVPLRTADLPFSSGTRSCIGQQFALLEARLILAVLLQAFQWSMSPHYEHWPEQTITLRPKKGMPICLQRVGAAAATAAQK